MELSLQDGVVHYVSIRYMVKYYSVGPAAHDQGMHKRMYRDLFEYLSWLEKLIW